MKRALLALLICGAAHAAPTLIDFEDRPNGTTVARNDYIAQGLVIQQGGILTSKASHSPTRSLKRATLELVAEFIIPPYRLAFTSGQSHIKLFAGGDSPAGTALQGTLRAFDAADHQLAQDGPKPVTAGAVQTAFDVISGTTNIAYVELEVDDSVGQVIEFVDDLLIEGTAPASVPTSAPVVTITAPPAGVPLAATTFLLQGTVTGTGLPASVLVSLTPAAPPGRPTQAPSVVTLPLSGSGTFSGNVTMATAPDLPHVLQVTAQNIAGFTGKAQELVAVIPPEIAAAAGSLGALQWGASGGGCVIEVYANGAVASDHGTTHLIQGDVFTKWMQWLIAKLQSTGATVVPGGALCPTEDERQIAGGTQLTPASTVRVQNFRGGRIFAKLPDGAHFVPAVFAQAIDKFSTVTSPIPSQEVGIGIPTSDPKRSITAKTWLYQQFKRLDQPSAMPTTIEIKGDPPVLWLERQGAIQSQLPLGTNLPFGAITPTIALQRSCSGREGPCDFTDAPDKVLSDPANVCSGRTYPFGPPEWTAVTGNYDNTSAYGLVRLSKISDGDFLGSHSYSDDWNVNVIPLVGSHHVLSLNNPDELELEWEFYFWTYFVTLYTTPLAGDLMFVNGRWIVDCGHDSFTTEIHPPSVLAFMRSNSTPGTDAYIWINGFYNGKPVDVDITPPPRPAPNAFLVVNKPFDSDAARDITVTATGDPDAFSFVRAHFTSSLRLVSIDGLSGEMHWQTGREYMGHWSTSWQISSQFQIATAGSAWWP